MSASGNAPLLLEDCQLSDLASLVALTQHVGWPHTADDWRDFLNSAEVFGHREPDGSLGSCTALARFGPELASVGLVIVHERHRGAGLARALMQRCIDTAGTQCLALIATPLGRPVYERLGFQSVAAVAKHVGNPLRERLLASARRLATDALQPIPQIVAVSPTATPLQRLLELDTQANGTARAGMLTAMSARSQRLLLAIDAREDIVGFTLAMPKLGLVQLAPVIAPDDAAALALIASAAADLPGALRIDVPLPRHCILNALGEAQWPRLSDDPVMTLQGKPLPGMRKQVGAISFQAWG